MLLFYICSIFSFLDTDCVFHYLVTLHDRFMFTYEIVTQTEMSCCPVAVKLGVQSFIFAVHLKSFRVGVYRVISFSLSVFFVTFLETYFRYF